MKKKSTYFTLLVLIIFQSCIEEYKPELDNSEGDKYVVFGEITDKEGFQKVVIAKTSSVYHAEKKPVSNCDVKVVDNKGNIYQFIENEQGVYSAYMESQNLLIGTAFKIDIITPSGNFISSDYDTLRECPPIDSVYYEIEKRITPDPDVKIPIIQFYLDYNGVNTKSKLIKIDLTQTYEYHAEYPLKWYYDGRVHQLTEPDYSKQVCWKTSKIPDIYLFSTQKLYENIFSKYPLHQIPNTSERLMFGYSLLIEQRSLSKDAYEYYEKLSSNILKDGSLYDTQPQQIEGNLYNLTNPNNKVIGYFNVCGIEKKRLFFKDIPNFPIEFDGVCTPMLLEWGPYILGERFVYLWYYGDLPGTYLLHPYCVDCTKLGGNLSKPDFWPI